MSSVKEHFNEVAKNYDFWKKKNWYYYNNLKNLYRSLITDGSSVLEVGCGTGDVLSALLPKRGVGIDLSDEMIKIAQEKYQKERNLKFFSATAELLSAEEKFDFIIMPDVIEHLENVMSTLAALKKFSNEKTKIIISMINPSWEPIFMILEKLHLKMPEGPHARISIDSLKKNMEEAGFVLNSEGYRLIIPASIPVLSLFNKYFYKMPLFRRLGAVYFGVFSL